MAQDTAGHFATPAPVKGTGSRNHFRFGEWKIGHLLPAFFASIVLLMIVGDVIAVLQLNRVETRARRFYEADQKSLAIMHVYLDVVTFRDALTGLAHDQNAHEFASRATALRDKFLRDVTGAHQALSSVPDLTPDPTILIRLETVRAALPVQVDTLLELVKVGDWQAIRFRLVGQEQVLIALSSSLVADVEQEVAQEHAHALESVQRTRRQLYIVLSITALLTIIVAAVLGWYATRRISRPLAQLDVGAQALARGEFGYQIELMGHDELAGLARAFNYAAQQLQKLYDDIKRSETHLAESNSKLEEAQRIAQVGYWEWDLTSNRMIWSDETYRIYGLQPQEYPIDIIVLQTMIHLEDVEFVFRVAEEAVRERLRTDVEHRIIRPTGELRTVHSLGDVKKDASGQPYQMFGTVQDITDRKRAEEALEALSRDLQESKAKLEEAQRISHVGYWEWDPLTDRVHWSDETYRIYGLRPQERPMDLATVAEKIHPEDWKRATEAAATGAPFKVECRLFRPTGEMRIADFQGDVKRDASGQPSLRFGTIQDITDRKRAEEALQLVSRDLQESNAKLEEAQRITHVGYWEWDLATDRLNWSDETYRIFGLRPQERPMNADELGRMVHPEDRDRIFREKEQTVNSGAYYDVEHRIVRPSGEVRVLNSTRALKKDESGRPAHFYGTVQDITERKCAEQKLRESEAYLAEAQRLSQTGSWAWNPAKGDIRYWSEMCYRLLGFDPAGPLPRFEEFAHRIHPDDQAVVTERFDQAIRDKADFEMDHRVVHPERGVRDIHVVGHAVIDGSGNLDEFVGTVIDVTERKRAEEALQKSQLYLSEGQRLAHMGSWAFNPAGLFEYWSQELFKIYGLDPQKGAPTLEQYLATVHPQDRDFMANTIKRMHAERSGCDIKKRIVRSRGDLRYIRCVGIPVVEGEVLKGFLGTAIDITEQELLTEGLKRQQAYLTEAQRLTHTGSWAINVATDEHFWSEEIFRIYEFDPVQVKPTWSLILDRVHPDDRASLEQRKKMEFTQTGWADSEADIRIVVPDGTIKHLHTIAHPVMDASGQIVELIGTTMDVTERKRVEDSLRRSESHLAEAQKLTHTGSWAWRLADRKTVHLSEEWYRIYDFDPAEGPPTWEKYLERVHPEDRLKRKNTIEQAIVEKADYDLEFRILLPNGMVRWIHTVGHPVFSGSGDLEQFAGSSTDITERKSAEQEREKLRQLEADLAHIDRVSTLGEMAASLAHEIKQPIAAAITSANSCIEWLSHEPPNLDRARAAAARIDKYGNRAAEIIDRIRSFYKKSPPQRELVDVNGIIQEMLTLLTGEATRFSIGMRTDLSAELPKIMVDRVQLQQVFMNLMLNGIEAMEDSGGELTVKSQLQDGQLQLSVSDTGVGLPIEKMDQIFSAFFTTKPQGSGMGLAISRSIVESHGGQLWATANSGAGATFHFTLPIQVTESSPLVA